MDQDVNATFPDIPFRAWSGVRLVLIVCGRRDREQRQRRYLSAATKGHFL